MEEEYFVNSSATAFLKAMIEDSTILDLSDEETEDYENNPENWEEVTNNSIEDALNMMFPNGMDDE